MEVYKYTSSDAITNNAAVWSTSCSIQAPPWTAGCAGTSSYLHQQLSFTLPSPSKTWFVWAVVVVLGDAEGSY